MSQAAMQAPLQWPRLDFAPVNLWSFPAAWKLELTVARPAVEQMTKVSNHQVNPHIRRLLSHR